MSSWAIRMGAEPGDVAATRGGPRQKRLPWRAWSAIWPKLAAAVGAIGVWQLVAWSGWRPANILPSPVTVASELRAELGTVALYQAVLITLSRAAGGYLVALILGSAVGIAIAGMPNLRTAIGSLITGMQTMPSIAWFPLAILLFGVSEAAVLFVVVLGAGPSIVNGFVSGIDHVPRGLVSAGRVLGARGLRLYRMVILPASLPSLVGGLKQGWAFAWRSLLAGELLVRVAG
ncbi:MAG TPA: ABC transporter permease subunit, partial [Candidatus Dormibacteraeota bacterium]|nr:ABC transporter permease subunit [Candidatus Dormibacteraeota bacterium]